MAFTNGVVSLAKDLIYGVCVLSTEGWVPWDMIDDETQDRVRSLLDHDATCPEEISRVIYGGGAK